MYKKKIPEPETPIHIQNHEKVRIPDKTVLDVSTLLKKMKIEIENKSTTPVHLTHTPVSQSEPVFLMVLCSAVVVALGGYLLWCVKKKSDMKKGVVIFDEYSSSSVLEPQRTHHDDLEVETLNNDKIPLTQVIDLQPTPILTELQPKSIVKSLNKKVPGLNLGSFSDPHHSTKNNWHRNANYDENDNYCLTSRRISIAPKLDLDPSSFSEQESADFEEEGVK